MSGVCLVPALGHTAADCVVRFGSDSWQAIFLAYTHPCLLASSQPEGAERIAVTAAVPNEPMAARVEPPCVGVVVFRAMLVVTPPAFSAGGAAYPHTIPRERETEPTLPIPRMRCGTSSVVFTGTKLAADSWPTMSPYKNNAR